MRRPGFYPLVWGILLGGIGGPPVGVRVRPAGSPAAACSSATCVAQPALAPALLTRRGGVASALDLGLC